MMEQEHYILALGYGGKLASAAAFEWDFRVKVGAEEQRDETGRERFIREFVNNGVENQAYVIVLDDYDGPLFRAFMEFGKQRIAKDRQLQVFLVIEDALDPEKQYRLYIQPDPENEQLPENEMMVDVKQVPKEVLLWMQARMGVRFYQRDNDFKMVFPQEE